jgi:hypothetical protein
MNESANADISSAMPTPNSNSAHETWSKPSANIRLTAKRKALLLAFLDDLDASATPYEAIDHCISVATASRKMSGRHLESESERADAIDHAADGLHRRADSIDRQLGDIAGSVANLVELMSAMSSMPGFGEDGFDGEAQPISEWLRHEAEQFGASIILASARWNGSERQGQTSMSMELVVERKAVGGYKGPDRKGAPSMVKLDGIGENNPLARDLPMREFYLACSKGIEGGWTISAHAIATNGGIGESLGSVRQN